MAKIAPVCGSWQTILVCIVEELAGGGSLAVAVGVSDMGKVTHDMHQITHDT